MPPFFIDFSSQAFILIHSTSCLVCRIKNRGGIRVLEAAGTVVLRRQGDSGNGCELRNKISTSNFPVTEVSPRCPNHPGGTTTPHAFRTVRREASKGRALFSVFPEAIKGIRQGKQLSQSNRSLSLVPLLLSGLACTLT